MLYCFTSCKEGMLFTVKNRQGRIIFLPQTNRSKDHLALNRDHHFDPYLSFITVFTPAQTKQTKGEKRTRVRFTQTWKAGVRASLVISIYECRIQGQKQDSHSLNGNAVIQGICVFMCVYMPVCFLFVCVCVCLCVYGKLQKVWPAWGRYSRLGVKDMGVALPRSPRGHAVWGLRWREDGEEREKDVCTHTQSHTGNWGVPKKREGGRERESEERERGWEISALEGGKDKDR